MQLNPHRSDFHTIDVATREDRRISCPPKLASLVRAGSTSRELSLPGLPIPEDR